MGEDQAMSLETRPFNYAPNQIDGDLLWQFDSIGAMVRFATEHRDREAQSCKNTEKAKKFSATPSFSVAANLALHGWDGAREPMDAVLGPVRERLRDLTELSPVRLWDVIGSEPDIDRYWLGEDEHMIDHVFIEQPRTSNVFTLLINGTYSHLVDTEKVLRRGAVIVGLIEAMAQVGAELEVWVENSVRNVAWRRASVLTRVHAAGSLLDMDALAFTIGHPSWLRRLAFGVWESASAHDRYAFGFGLHGSGSYGYPIGCQHVNHVDASIMLSLDNTMQMETDPVGWIMSHLEMFGLIPESENV